MSLILLLIAIIALVTYALLALTSQPVAEHPFFANQDIMAIAHRGGRGQWPENTLFAFEQAAALDVDVLEMDIHGTADGVLVTIHDDTVDRTTDSSGPVQDFTLAELKELDAGYKWSEDGQTYPFRGRGVTISTLEEIFEAFPEYRMNIEIKQVEPSIVDTFCQMVRDYGREDLVLVGSFDAGAVEAFREACPEVATSTTEPEVRTFFILNTLFLDAVYRPPAEAFQVPEFSDDLQVVTERFIGNAHQHNMDVHVWTVNEVEDMERLIDLGVDGIITDYPERLMNVLGH